MTRNAAGEDGGAAELSARATASQDARPDTDPLPAAPDALKELAKRAVEAQRKDTRTTDEKVRDGVNFIMGPGGDEGTRIDPACLVPDAPAPATVALTRDQIEEKQTVKIAMLRVELAAARKDAERYRWLRSNVTWFDPKQHVGPVLAPVSNRIFYHSTDYELDTLDAVLDAAIAAAKEPK